MFKFSRFFIQMALAFILTLPAFAQTQSSSKVADYPALTDFFNVVSEIASDGASLAFFGYSENRRTVNNEHCREVKSKEVSDYFNEILETISYDPNDSDDRLTKTLIKQAKSDWLKLMKQGPFEICHGSVSGHMTMGSLTIFKSKKYFIEFEFGYED